MLGKNVSRHFEIFFLTFPRKKSLTFHGNCLPWRQFPWHVKAYFLGKIRKTSSICGLLSQPWEWERLKLAIKIVALSFIKSLQYIKLDFSLTGSILKESKFHSLSPIMQLTSKFCCNLSKTFAYCSIRNQYLWILISIRNASYQLKYPI